MNNIQLRRNLSNKKKSFKQKLKWIISKRETPGVLKVVFAWNYIQIILSLVVEIQSKILLVQFTDTSNLENWGIPSLYLIRNMIYFVKISLVFLLDCLNIDDFLNRRYCNKQLFQ